VGLVTSQFLAGEMFFIHASLVAAMLGLAALTADTATWSKSGDWLPGAASASVVLGGLLMRRSTDGSPLGILSRSLPALAAVGMVTAVAAGVWATSRTPPARMHSLATAAAAIGVVFALVNWRNEATVYYVREQSSLESTPLADPRLLELGEWTERSVPEMDVVATSAGLCRPDACDEASFVRTVTVACSVRRTRSREDCHLSYGEPLSAFTERRSYLNNFSQFSTGRPTNEMLRRARISLEFAQRPGAASVAPLREAGIRWFIVDKDLPHADDYGSVGTVRYENERFIVLELFDA
jgi:hypothetical protein